MTVMQCIIQNPKGQSEKSLEHREMWRLTYLHMCLIIAQCTYTSKTCYTTNVYNFHIFMYLLDINSIWKAVSVLICHRQQKLLISNMNVHLAGLAKAHWFLCKMKVCFAVATDIMRIHISLAISMLVKKESKLHKKRKPESICMTEYPMCRWGTLEWLDGLFVAGSQEP